MLKEARDFIGKILESYLDKVQICVQSVQIGRGCLKYSKVALIHQQEHVLQGLPSGRLKDICPNVACIDLECIYMALVLKYSQNHEFQDFYHVQREGNRPTMTIRTNFSTRCKNQLVKYLHCIMSACSPTQLCPTASTSRWINREHHIETGHY